MHAAAEGNGARVGIIDDGDGDGDGDGRDCSHVIGWSDEDCVG